MFLLAAGTEQCRPLTGRLTAARHPFWLAFVRIIIFKQGFWMVENCKTVSFVHVINHNRHKNRFNVRALYRTVLKRKYRYVDNLKLKMDCDNREVLAVCLHTNMLYMILTKTT